jgi:hypothetical protein
MFFLVLGFLSLRENDLEFVLDSISIICDHGGNNIVFNMF